jgi:hypothetical protein
MIVIGDAIGNAVDTVVDTVRRAVAEFSGPGPAKFRVEPDKVYELANRFDAIADKIQAGYMRETLCLWVESPGRDKPSTDAAERLTDTSFGGAGLITRLRMYVEEVRNAAASLRETGKQYGLTDTTEGGRLSATNL